MSKALSVIPFKRVAAATGYFIIIVLVLQLLSLEA
jgi:hypothetical protein